MNKARLHLHPSPLPSRERGQDPTHSALETPLDVTQDMLRLRSGRAECPTPDYMRGIGMTTKRVFRKE